jgi:hypothetical protein
MLVPVVAAVVVVAAAVAAGVVASTGAVVAVAVVVAAAIATRKGRSGLSIAGTLLTRALAITALACAHMMWLR